MFELKKDISTPNAYIRAGAQKTKQEWEKLFPNAFVSSNEWFFDLSKEEVKTEKDIITEIVDRVFAKNSLASRSYHSAAMECCKLYKIYLDDKK